MTTIEPLNDRVVIRMVAETIRASGIILPNTVEMPNEGVVVATGPGKVDATGVLRPTGVAPGDRILFGKYMNQQFRLDDAEYATIRGDDIIGILRKKE